MSNTTRFQALSMAGFIMLVGLSFYLCYPKYELYQSAGDGVVIYRFNKITGRLQWADQKNVWNDAVPLEKIVRK